MGGEPGGEGCDDPVDHAHKHPAEGHYEEAQEAKEDVRDAHILIAGKLLKEVIEDLERAGRLVGRRAGPWPTAPWLSHPCLSHPPQPTVMNISYM